MSPDFAADEEILKGAEDYAARDDVRGHVEWQTDALAAIARKYQRALKVEGAALEALTAKIDALNGDSRLQGIFTIAAVHGFKYEGPNWESELKQAKTARAEVRRILEGGE